MPEMWDSYDVNRQKTGRTYERKVKAPDHEYRLVVHMCIFNSKGEMLIQQRQPWKSNPNKWDFTVGGSSVAGETSQMAIARECKEELGFDYDFSKVHPMFTIYFDYGFDDFYVLKEDIDETKLTLQEDEVQNVKWASLDEILEMLKNDQFINYQPDFMKGIFAIKDNMSVYSGKITF